MPQVVRHANPPGTIYVGSQDRSVSGGMCGERLSRGSGWKDYLRTGAVCGHKLPENLLESAELPEPIFTPSTKAEEGHDENITEESVRELVGEETATRLREISLQLYNEAREYARQRGIIIADTKFEFGRDSKGEIIFIDEVLTPDSSRFWPAESYSPGKSQPSFDKQFVRDYLETLEWNKQPPAPPLPEEVAKPPRPDIWKRTDS